VCVCVYVCMYMCMYMCVCVCVSQSFSLQACVEALLIAGADRFVADNSGSTSVDIASRGKTTI
jgi:hypothetical protein